MSFGSHDTGSAPERDSLSEDAHDLALEGTRRVIFGDTFGDHWGRAFLRRQRWQGQGASP